jgi:hypothetical protein
MQTKQKPAELPGTDSTVIEIIDPVKSQSYPDCPKCSQKKSYLRRRLFANVFDRWTLELKLHHYHIEYIRSRNPLNILKKHLTSPVGAPFGTDWKFLSIELRKLSVEQLYKLRNAQQCLILNKTKELQVEKEERYLQNSCQQNMKKQLHELEALARDIMKPYVNLYPSCEELARLMLA